MTELRDITIYLDALERRVLGRVLDQVRIANPFVLRTATPPLLDCHGRAIQTLRRIGKRIVFGLAGDLWLVLHLMIAGRLHWRKPRGVLRRKTDLAALDFATGSLLLTESGTKKRASIHRLQGSEALRRLDPAGWRSWRLRLTSLRSRLPVEVTPSNVR